MPKLTARAREMRKVVRALDSSGMTVRDYSSESGIPESTLWRWRRRLKELEGQPPEPSFLPVTVIPDPQRVDAFTVELARGRRIHLPARFDEDAVRRLIAVVESC